jgi:1-acyl-sn-glycerol-3-phosphate acyltransferase
VIAQRIAQRLIDLAGWEFETPPPTERKYVCLGVPHTSNWDGVALLTFGAALGIDMAWMIKDEWLRGPGALLRRIGAVGVDRRQHTNIVQAMIDEFDRRDAFVLIIPPEGTRSRTDGWKSGFYNIALGAKVPVVPGYLDYARKRAGMGPAIHLTGDVRADMDRLRAYYREVAPQGRYPDQFGPIGLRAESAGAGGPSSG